MKIQHWVISGAIYLGASSVAGPALADMSACSGLPSQGALRSALQTAVATPGNGGLGFNMWATLVANDGTVCAVAFSGGQYTDQWLGSRVISAQKANTANDFSLSNGAPPGTALFPSGLALSTANLYSAVQPGGTLYGLQHSNPVDTEVAYRGPATNFGTGDDPMRGRRVGGVNVFGGGLGLYNAAHVLIGAVGVSGDSSCADHNIAWRTRHTLGLDYVPPGESGDSSRPDNIVYD